MKLSTRCRYGLRALADLAVRAGTGPVALGQIAARQDLSLKYLEQDFTLLRKAGIVRSVKGAQGGYILAREPADVKIGDVIRILEGRIDLIGRTAPDETSTPIRRCLEEKVWQPLNRVILEHLDSLTLADLVEPCQSGLTTAPLHLN